MVVRGRLWRLANPSLPDEFREARVRDLMAARRAILSARGDDAALAVARGCVDAAKHALGERGPAWWDDGAPDYNRRMAANTPYAAWYAERVAHDNSQQSQATLAGGTGHCSRLVLVLGCRPD